VYPPLRAQSKSCVLVGPAVVAWTMRLHDLVTVSPVGMQASSDENDNVPDSHVALWILLSLVFSVTPPGCWALGGMTLVAMEKLLLAVDTVPGGTPDIAMIVAVVVVLVELGTHVPVPVSYTHLTLPTICSV